MPPPAPTSIFDRALASVLVAAFGLRLAAVLWLSDTIPYSDFFYYHEAGRLQALDWGFFFRYDTVQRYREFNWWPPGYPFFLAALYTLFGPNFRVAVFTQVLLGTLVVGLVYAIGTRAAGRRSGLMAAWLVALDPTYIFSTNLLASENLFVVWFALGLWFVGRARHTGREAEPARRDAVLAGLTLALAALTRAAGLCVPLVAAAWLHRGVVRRAAGRATALALLAGFAVGLAPWALRNLVVAKRPGLVCFGGGLNFAIGHSDIPAGHRDITSALLAGSKSAADIDREGWALGFQGLAAHPGRFFTGAVRKTGALFAPPTYALHSNSAILLPDARADPSLAGLAAAKRAKQAAKDRLLHGPFKFMAALHGYLLLGATLLACVVAWSRLPGELRLMVYIVAAWIAVHAVFWAQPRFRYPMDVPMALVAGWWIASWRSARRGRSS